MFKVPCSKYFVSLQLIMKYKHFLIVLMALLVATGTQAQSRATKGAQTYSSQIVKNYADSLAV